MDQETNNLKYIKYFLIAALAIFLFLFKKNPAKTLQTYTNDSYNFSIDYPADWSLGATLENNNDREIISPDGQITCRAYAFVNALQNEQGQPQTLDEFISWIYDNGEYLLDGVETTMANRRAYKTLSQDENGLYRQSTYVIEPDIGYSLYCLYPDLDMKAQNKNDYQLLVDSFSIQVEE